MNYINYILNLDHAKWILAQTKVLINIEPYINNDSIVLKRVLYSDLIIVSNQKPNLNLKYIYCSSSKNNLLWEEASIIIDFRNVWFVKPIYEDNNLISDFDPKMVSYFKYFTSVPNIVKNYQLL